VIKKAGEIHAKPMSLPNPGQSCLSRPSRHIPDNSQHTYFVDNM